MSTLNLRGSCHVLGDGIPLDEGFIPFELAIQRVTDPQKLIPHLFEKIAPGFSSRAKAGDIVLAGADFACGKPHVQGFIALAALGMGVVCVSMPYKNLRRAVARGVPVLVDAPPAAGLAADGEDVEVDFATGRFVNHTRGQTTALPPLSPILLDIVRSGGMEGMLKAWLAAHPGQAASAADQALLDTVNSVAVTVVKKKA